MNVYIPFTLDMSLFALDCIGDPFGVLDLFLAHGDLAGLDRLLRARHLLLAHRHAVGFTLADGRLRWLSRARTTLDVDFLVGDWHIHRLLLTYHVFAQARLTRLHWLLLDVELFLPQLEALLVLGIGLRHATTLRTGHVKVIPSITAEDSRGVLLSISSIDHYYGATC